MRKKMVLFILGLSLLIGGLAYLIRTKEKIEVSEEGIINFGSSFDRTSADIIGTPTASSTLTPLYSGNTRILVAGNLENLHLDVRYSPGAFNSWAQILVEGSNDGGVNYFPLSTQDNNTANILVYTEGTSSTEGIPIIIPGDQTSVVSSTHQAMLDFDIVADHVKISIRENTTSSVGFAYIRGVLTSKK